MTKTTNGDRRAVSLGGGEIATVTSNRRSFLTRAVGTAGAFALATLSAGACSSGGGCDSDRTDGDPRNNDPVDPLGDPVGAGRGDPCN